MRWMRLQSVVCRLVSRKSGYLQRRWDTLYVIPRRPLEPTVPQPVRIGFILSCLPLLYGVSPPLLPAVSFESAPRCQGFVPLRDISDGVHFRGSSHLPLRSALGFSQPLDGLLHHSDLRAYCIPLPRRVSSVQGLLPIRSGLRLVAGPCPHAVIVFPLAGHPAAASRRLGFEALLRVSMRSSGSTVRPPLRSLPSSVFPPPSGRRLPPRARFPVPSARDVTHPGLHSSP